MKKDYNLQDINTENGRRVRVKGLIAKAISGKNKKKDSAEVYMYKIRTIYSHCFTGVEAIFTKHAGKIKNYRRRQPGPVLFFFGMLCPVLLVLVLDSCKSPDPLTRRLFMQSKRANLELPAGMADSTGRAMLGEQLSYRHQDNTSLEVDYQDSIGRARRSINQMQYLGEVTITAKVKQKFAPERDGKVDADFVIRVPKELLSPDWRINLYPKLLHNDSVVDLKPVVLRGENFLARQQADSLAYQGYLNSIIPASAYDSLFLDRKGIARDMRQRQQYYWQLYDREFKQVMAYLDWKNGILERYAAFNAKKDGSRLNLYHKYMRNQMEESVRLLTTGVDTTGISRKYGNKFNKRAGLLPQYHLHRELTQQKVPKKYKAFFLDEPRVEDITNHSTTAKDSVQIAAHRYFFDRIADNELRDKRRDEVRQRMIPFGRETNLRLDSVVNTARDFVFYYRQEYPVTPGLDKLRITMSGQVTATDRSGYTLPKSDTLHYVISSLSQLADTTLVIRQTKLYRNMYDRMTIYPRFEADKAAFSISYPDNRRQVDTLVSQYRKLTEGMSLRMDSMQIHSWASLDGGYDTNFELSRKRAESLSAYLQNAYPELISANTVKIIPKGEDWQGFVNELKKREDIVNRDSIFAMVQRTAFPDKTEQEIRRQYKNDYKIIRDEIYPKLRRMDITFHLSRPGMEATDSIHREVKQGYEEGLRLLQQREYWKALEILAGYPDYNTALCLACMGYNGKAYDLLKKLPESAGNEYLLAIVSRRMDKDPEAVEHLLKAVGLDPDKAYRIDRDPEVSALVHKYNLRAQIDGILDAANNPPTGPDEEGRESTGQMDSGQQNSGQSQPEQQEQTPQHEQE